MTKTENKPIIISSVAVIGLLVLYAFKDKIKALFSSSTTGSTTSGSNSNTNPVTIPETQQQVAIKNSDFIPAFMGKDKIKAVVFVFNEKDLRAEARKATTITPESLYNLIKSRPKDGVAFNISDLVFIPKNLSTALKDTAYIVKNDEDTVSAVKMLLQKFGLKYTEKHLSVFAPKMTIDNTMIPR